jgi:hypothetical protein
MIVLMLNQMRKAGLVFWEHRFPYSSGKLIALSLDESLLLLVTEGSITDIILYP